MRPIISALAADRGRILRVGRTLLCAVKLDESESTVARVYACRERRESRADAKDAHASLLVDDKERRSTASSVHCVCVYVCM